MRELPPLDADEKQHEVAASVRRRAPQRVTEPGPGIVCSEEHHVVALRCRPDRVAARQPDEARRLQGLIEGWEQAFLANPRGWK